MLHRAHFNIWSISSSFILAFQSGKVDFSVNGGALFGGNSQKDRYTSNWYLSCLWPKIEAASLAGFFVECQEKTKQDKGSQSMFWRNEQAPVAATPLHGKLLLSCRRRCCCCAFRSLRPLQTSRPLHSAEGEEASKNWRTRSSKMAENLMKQPARSILKGSKSFESSSSHKW